MRLPLPLDRELPDWLKRAGLRELLAVFAKTFGVDAPDVSRMAYPDALSAFREFTAACMEEALSSPAYASVKRGELEDRARRLGKRVRAVLAPRDGELGGLISALYATIGIDVEDGGGGRLLFRRCYFSGRYTPGLCAFMSALDSGFVGGLAGGKELRFEARITEGDPCCVALMVERSAS